MYNCCHMAVCQITACASQTPIRHCVLRRGDHNSGGHSKKRTQDLNTLTIIMPLAMTTPSTTTSL